MNAGTPLMGGAMEWYGFGTYGERDGRTEGFYRQASDARTVTALHPDGFLAQVLIDLTDSVRRHRRARRCLELELRCQRELRPQRRRLRHRQLEQRLAWVSPAPPASTPAGCAISSTRPIWIFSARSMRRCCPSRCRWRSVSSTAAERFEVEAGEPASYLQGPVRLPNGQLAAAGAQVFPGFRPDNATTRDRHSTSLYLDLETDFTERWNATLAARGEDYSDFGSDVNYKLATRFEAFEGLALRGGVSTGFRAPSLHQQFFSTTSTNNVAGRLVDVGTFAAHRRRGSARSARRISIRRPSLNLSAGIVFDLIDRLSLTLDYYRIDIDDRIVPDRKTRAPAARQRRTQPCKRCSAAAGYTSISSAEIAINGLDTRTHGIDVVATLPP